MDEQAQRPEPPRRLRALPTPTDLPRHTAVGQHDEHDVELVRVPPLLASAPAGPPRDPALDALLREVDVLRGALRSDLTLAATAAGAGEDHLAAWLLSQEDERVAAFEERVLVHLAAVDLEPVATVARKRRVLMGPAAPIVAAAAAVIGFVVGVVPERVTTTSPSTSAAAMESFADVSRLTRTDASPAEVSAAADRLYADIAELVESAASDPAAAEQALLLLESGTLMLSSSENSEDEVALRRVIAQAKRLVLQLRRSLPSPPPALAPVPVLPQREPSAQAKPSSPAPKPSSSPAARPSNQPSPQPPAPSSSPSPSPSSGGLPGAPGAGGL